MIPRFKKAGFVDPIFGIESLRDMSMIDYYSSKFVIWKNEISPTISQEDIDKQKADPFKNLSKVMKKREREIRKLNREDMHYFALEELKKRKVKRIQKRLNRITENSMVMSREFCVTQDD